MGKFRVWFKLSLFVSSYIPLWLIFAIQMPNSVLEVGSLSVKFWKIFIGISLLSTISIFALLNYVRTRSHEIVDVESYSERTDILASYIIPYIFPFMQLDYSKTSGVATFLIIFLALMVIQVPSNRLFINPMLALLGFKIIEFESPQSKRVNMLVVKHDTNLEDGSVNAVRLGKGVFVDKSGGMIGWL